MSSPAGPSPEPRASTLELPAPRAGGGLLALCLGAALALVALIAKGGLSLGPSTTVEILVTLAGTAIAILAALRAPTPARAWGGISLTLLAALTAWTAVSVVWSYAPDASWVEANRAVAYLAAFAGAIGLARLAPRRAGSVATAVVIGALVICVIALAYKCFPAALDSREDLARLRQPVDYWNALGLIAAMAVPPVLWIGARREGSAATRALAFGLLGVLMTALMLSFSRGALVAVGVGLAFWFVMVPLRLRALTLLLVAGAGAGAVVAYAFSKDALTKDHIALASRIGPGHDLALAIVLMSGGLLLAGFGVERYRERRPASAQLRRRAGIAALVVLALLPVALLGALATSKRGLGGSVSHGWHTVFSTTTQQPSYGPDRLTSVGSKRGSYWHESYRIWSHHKVLGTGAGSFVIARKRFRKDAVDVRSAHGYIPQTASDLGSIGLGLSLALLVAWLIAAGRAVGVAREDLDPRRLPERVRTFAATASHGTPTGPPGARRATLLTLATVVVIFGAHSAIDWTWQIPGTALVALVCAGYLAGLGPADAPGAATAAPLRGRLLMAGMLVLIALAAAWAIWQPQRSVAADEAALASLDEGRVDDARVEALGARSRDPLSIQPLLDLSTVAQRAGRGDLAVAALERAVRLAPADPESWRAIADYRLNTLGDVSGAYAALRAAVYLDPLATDLRQEFIDVYQRLPRAGARQSKPHAPQPAAATSPPAATTATTPKTVTSKPAGVSTGAKSQAKRNTGKR